jgi:MinD superfamily P-loop ATPase
MQIAVASGKGGVGKSSITSSLSLLFSKESKITVVDADADTPNLEILLNVKEWKEKTPLKGERVAEIDPQKCTGCGICSLHCPYECIYPEENYFKVEEVLCEGCNVCSIVCPERDVISFKPSIPGYVKWGITNYGFNLVMAELLPGRPNSGKLVFEAKKRASEFKSEVTLIDSAAGIGCSVIASLNGSDLAVVIVEPTDASLSDGKRLLKIVNQFGIKAVGIINKFDINPEFSDRIKRDLESEGIPVIGKLPYDKSVVESVVKGKPPIEAFPDSPFSNSMLEIFEKLKSFIQPF